MSSPIVDLYIPTKVYNTTSAFLTATNQSYGLDLKQLMDNLQLNTYRRIRCVNYLRKITQNCTYDATSTKLEAVIKDNIAEWKDCDDLLIPLLEEDGLVQYAATANHNYDSDDDQYWEDEDEDDVEENEQNEQNEQNENEVDEIQFAQNALKQQNDINKQQSVQMRMMQRQIDQLSTLLNDARTAFKQYAFEEGGLISTTTPGAVQHYTQNTTQIADPKSKFGKDDHYYFASYSQRNIHEEMLSDRHRTESYEEAFKQLAPILKDKVVLDVGCGTGILSMFAARNGAKHVIGVDAADIIDKTREIVEKNGFKDRISLVKGKVEEIVLPFDTVDIIVSEWMGYYLLYESMLPSVFYARNKWLRRADTNISVFEEKKAINSDYIYNDTEDRQLERKFGPQTRLLPDASRMYVAGCHTRELRGRKIGFWENVYGFDMSVMIDQADTFPNSEVDILPGNDVITTNNMYGVFDLMKDTAKELDFFTENIQIVAEKDDILDAFIVWFDTPFTDPLGDVNSRVGGHIRNVKKTTESATIDANEKRGKNDQNNTKITSPQDIILTTAPDRVPTHWKQTILRLNNVLKVQKGDVISLSINSYIRKDNHRHYNVDIKYSYQTTLDIDLNEKTGIVNTQFAKPGDFYEQSYSLQ
jgi:protein arginine N-methyltransferase 1